MNLNRHGLWLTVELDDYVKYGLYEFHDRFIVARYDRRLPENEQETARETLSNKTAAENTLSAWVAEERKNRRYT